jgi:UPF0755 protein
MFALLLVGCSMMTDHYGAPADPSDTEARTFEVPAGANARSLAPALADAGLVQSADDFVMYVRLSKEGGCIKAGPHALTPALSAHDLIETMCGVPLANDVAFTVIEGWRIREIDAALAAKGWTQPGEYAGLAGDPKQFSAPYPLPTGTLEGYLFPETYMVSPDRWDTQQFIQRQLDLLATRFYTPHVDAVGASPHSFNDLVIMASMLEREEPKVKNRPLVAGILWKRIDSGWNLGVDATSRYTLEKWNDRKAFLVKLRDPNDPYNTRLRGGLPPTAIGNPSAPSLQAAMAPVDSEFWYYLHDSRQDIHPSKNAAQHEAYRRKYDVY